MKMRVNDKGQFQQIERDLSGQKMHKLTAIKRVRLRKGKEKAFRWYWECLCDCGNLTTILEFSFYAGKTQSCGCAMTQCNVIPGGMSGLNAHYGHYISSAKHRGIEFSLPRKDFDEITQNNCYYCGSAPWKRMYNKKSNIFAIANGIDRVDNDVGYVVDNCVPCCAICNKMKGTLSTIQFYQLIETIYNRIKEK